MKITIKASTGGDEDYESMDRDELESLLEELQEQREDLEDEEPDDPCSDAYDEWEDDVNISMKRSRKSKNCWMTGRR